MLGVATRYVLVFCFSAGIMAFEIFSNPFLSFLLHPGYQLMVIVIALLGQAGAAALVRFFPVFTYRHFEGLTPWQIVSVFFFVLLASLFISVGLNNFVVESLTRSVSTNTAEAISNRLQLLFPVFGVALALPHLYFGLYIQFAYCTEETSSIRKLCSIDLMGGAFGSFALVLLMEEFGYSSLIAFVIALLVPAVFISSVKLRTKLLLYMCLLGVSCSTLVNGAKWLEPLADLRALARDYTNTMSISELWSEWNSSSRFSLIKTDSNGYKRSILVLNRGAGHALVPDVSGKLDFDPVGNKLLKALDIGQKVLVLFAGVGNEVGSIASITAGQAKITAVELNSKMIQRLKSDSEFPLDKFFTNLNAELIVQEARIFVETTKEKYDLILIPYSGTNRIQLLASQGATSQYCYTEEAIKRYVDRLSDDGLLIFYWGNKVRLLDGLRRSLPGKTLVDSVAIVDSRPISEIVNGDSNTWDRDADYKLLVFRKSGLHQNDIASLFRSFPDTLVYAPGFVRPGFEVYDKLISTTTPDALISSLERDRGKKLRISSDNEPFLTNRVSLSDYFDLGLYRSLGTSIADAVAGKVSLRLIQCELISIILCTLTLIPLLFLSRHALREKRGLLISEIYFSVSAAGFFVLEVSFFQMLSLLLGHSGYSLAVSLGGFLAFSGLGSMYALNVSSGKALLRKAFIGTVILIVSVIAGRFAVINYLGDLLDWPFILRILESLFLLALPAFFAGQFFPLGVQGFTVQGSYMAHVRLVAVSASIYGVIISSILLKTNGLNLVLGLASGMYLVALMLVWPYLKLESKTL